MGQDGGLYVHFLMDDTPRFVRVNWEYESTPDSFSVFDPVFERFANGPMALLGEEKNQLFWGGQFGFPEELPITDNLFYFHDRTMIEFDSTVRAGTDDLLCYTPLKEYLPDQGRFNLSLLHKFVVGCQVFEEDRMQSKLASGAWEFVEAPTYLVYGRNSKSLYSVAKEYGTSLSRNGSETLVDIRSARGFNNTATDVRVTTIRVALTSQYLLKNPKPLNLEYLEKIIDFQISNYSSDCFEFLDVFNDLSKRELDQKLKALSKQRTTSSLMRENQEMRGISSEIHLNRYAYEFAKIKLFTRRQAGNQNEALAADQMRP